MSRIKVDALQGTSGSDTAITLSGANATVGGTLAVTGIHTVGNNAIYTSDGGAVTQNLIQGIAKFWVEMNPENLSGTGTTGVGDSFNLTSITDDSTGNHTVNINNDMSSIEYSSPTCVNSAQTSGGIGIYGGAYSHATGSFILHSRRNNAAVDTNFFACTVHGDLA